MGVPEDGGTDDRIECQYCGHKFAADRFPVHEGICARAQKKRRVFDAKKQRLRGTEAAGYQRSAQQKPERKQPEMIGGKPKYKVEHENLVKALRAARQMTAYEDARAAGKKVGPPPKMPVLQEVPDDRITCPICGIKLGQVQYERHRAQGACSSAGVIHTAARRKEMGPLMRGGRGGRR
jgi:DNA-directed RNA polymerase subunit RPC12/RpoP